MARQDERDAAGPKDLSGGPATPGTTSVVGQQGLWGSNAGTVRFRTPEETRDDYESGVSNPNQEQVGPNGAEADVARYRSLAGDSQGRQSYQLQFGKALGSELRANDVRNKGEMDALGMLRGAAAGGAPSRAVIEGNQVAGNSLESALAANAGARGSGTAMGQPRGQMNPLMALANQSGQQLGGISQGVGARSNEMIANRGAYGTGAGVVRGQDYAGQGLAQDRAEAQAKSDIAQRHLNDSRELGFERDAFNVRKAQQGGVLSMEEIEAQRAAAKAKADEANTSTGEDIARGAAQAVVNFSDRRAKNTGGALTKLLSQAKQMEASVNASKESLKYGASVGAPPESPEPRVLGGATGKEMLRERDPSELPRELNPLRAMMLKAPEPPKPPSAMPDKMDATNPYAHRSLFGDAPEGYAASRKGHAGYMFGKAPEASYGDLRGSERDETAGLAPGSADAAHGEGHALNKKDERISLSDEKSKDVKKGDDAAVTEMKVAPRAPIEEKTEKQTNTRTTAPKTPEYTSPRALIVDKTSPQYVRGPQGTVDANADKNQGTAPGKDTASLQDTMSGDRHRNAPVDRPAASSMSAGNGYERKEKVETPEQRTQRFLEKSKDKTRAAAPISDENAKETKGGPLAELQRDANRKMRGETYTYKDGFGEDPEKVHHGFMAQTLEENPITALAVRDDPSGFKKVDNTDMLRVTAAGVAENQNQIDDMATELEKLKSRRSRRA